MASIINATTTNGVAISADNSGILQLATNSGTTALTLSVAQAATFVSSVTATSLTAPILSSATTLSLQTNGSTTAVTIDASQNFGLGTTVIRSKFASVNGTDNIAGGSDASGLAGSFVSATGTAQQSTLSIESNDTVAANTGGSIGLGGRYNSTSWAQWAKISSLKDNATSGEYGGSLAFSTRANGGSNTEAMRIDSSRNLLVGNGSVTATNKGLVTIKQQADADTGGLRLISPSNDNAWAVRAGSGSPSALYFGYNGTSKAIIDATSGAYTALSDLRLKENIIELTGSLDKVLQLSPKNYVFIGDESNAIQSGLIAQEVLNIIPEVVSIPSSSNEYYGLNYAGFVPHLIKSIQEQQALITTLQNQITALNAKVGI